MKKTNIILIFLLSLTLIFTITGCAVKVENNFNGESKPSSTTDKDPNKNDKDKTPNNDKYESGDKTPTTDKDSDKDNPAPKPEPIPDDTQKPVVKPEKIEITSLIGQWKSQIDACEILAEAGIELDATILINVKTDFGTDNSYRVSISPLEVENTLKIALAGEYDDNFINSCVSTLDDLLYESGIYKFEGNNLLIKWDNDPDFTEVTHNFKGSADKLVISFSSDERNYEHIK